MTRMVFCSADQLTTQSLQGFCDSCITVERASGMACLWNGSQLLQPAHFHQYPQY